MKKLLVFFMAIAMVGAFTVSAMAAEWDFYGSARMATFWNDPDSDWNRPAGASFDGIDEGTVWDLEGISRVGASVKSGAIAGRFEYGTGVNLRHLYGTWDFGEGELLVGQTWTPLGAIGYSNQVWNNEDGLCSFGKADDCRDPMIMVSVKGLKVAFLKNAGTDLGTGRDLEIKFPKVEVSYHLALDKLFADVFAGYQTYEIKNIAGIGDQDVNAYLVGLGGGVDLGKAYVNLGGYYAVNSGQFGLGAATDDDARLTGSDIDDNKTMGGLIVAGFKASDKLTVEAGFGYVRSEMDDEIPAYTDKDDAMSYYVNATVNLADGCFVVPEVGVVDLMDDGLGKSEGKDIYAGMKWQIDF